MINKIKEISDKEFIELIKNSTNIKEVLFKLGYTTVGNSWGSGTRTHKTLVLETKESNQFLNTPLLLGYKESNFNS